MRPQPAPPPAPGDAERRPAFARQIECDGEGYAAPPPTPARGGGRREAGSWRGRRDDTRG